MTPCGVVPAVGQSVNDILEYAADHIGKFEADRFKRTVDQGFYDLDETPHKQMLYVALLTVSHIWNLMMKSFVEVRPAGIGRDQPADFLVLLHRFKNQVKTIERTAAIHCPESLEKAPHTKNAQRGSRCAEDECRHLFFTATDIIQQPFGIAQDIIRIMAPEEWQTYKLLNVTPLPLR
jgi:hypothetical protein